MGFPQSRACIDKIHKSHDVAVLYPILYQSGALWDMGQVYYEICAIAILLIRFDTEACSLANDSTALKWELYYICFKSVEDGSGVSPPSVSVEK